MSDFMTRPTSCRRRTEILTHLTPILRTNVIMKQLFLQVRMKLETLLEPEFPQT